MVFNCFQPHQRYTHIPVMACPDSRVCICNFSYSHVNLDYPPHAADRIRTSGWRGWDIKACPSPRGKSKPQAQRRVSLENLLKSRVRWADIEWDTVTPFHIAWFKPSAARWTLPIWLWSTLEVLIALTFTSMLIAWFAEEGGGVTDAVLGTITQFCSSSGIYKAVRMVTDPVGSKRNMIVTRLEALAGDWLWYWDSAVIFSLEQARLGKAHAALVST